MPTSNELAIDSTDLSDFFGGSWDFTPNWIFSDQGDKDDQTMPTLHIDGKGLKSNDEAEADSVPPPSVNDSNHHHHHHINSHNYPTNHVNKTKPPNLFETLRRGAMYPMMMSPYNGYGDMMGMDWSGQMMPEMAYNRMVPSSSSSPAMMDANQMLMMQQIKRPRVSPMMGGMDCFVPAGYGMGMVPMGMMGRRPAKMPLSPVPKTERPPQPIENNDKMPIVLPFTNANNHHSSKPTASNFSRSSSQDGKPAPLKPLPIEAASAQPPKPKLKLSLEENMERNIKSFLQETRALEWENVTVIELKRILRQYELNATGKKAELMDRINKIRTTYCHLEDGEPNNNNNCNSNDKNKEEQFWETSCEPLPFVN